MSSFYFDDEEGYQVAEDHAREEFKKRRNTFNPNDVVESFQALPNTLQTYQPTNAVDPSEEYSYHKYIRESQYQPAPPPQVKDPTTGEDVILGERNFQVSLIGEDGPDEYLSVSRAADRLTTIWEDAADIRYKLDQQYYTGRGGGYTPIQFGIPKYTGDAGYPVVDPNPGQCRPGFLKDQFGRCLHMSWFNLPFSPAGSPWVDISGNSIIQNGMYPINGVCPPEMFLASNGKCFFFPAPPPQYPPPPVSGVPISGSAGYAGAFYGGPSQKLYGQSPTGRIYNTPPRLQEVYYGTNTVTIQGEGNEGRINQVRVEKKYLTPGDRAIIHTNVVLNSQGGGFHLGVVVSDLNFKVSTPEIPVMYQGISEEVETNFLIPLGTEPGDYIGEVQLVKGAKKIDSVNFVLSVD